jgi:serine/threonine protein kinase
LIHQKVIKLADFGISKRIDDNGSFKSIPYVDPVDTYDDRKSCDIFSLGVLFWEISSGRKPFENINYDIKLAIKIARGDREKIVPGTSTDYSNLYSSNYHNF